MLVYRSLIGVGMLLVLGCVPHTEEPAAATPAAAPPAGANPETIPLRPPDPPLAPAVAAQPTSESTAPHAETSPAQPENATATTPPAITPPPDASAADASSPGNAPVRVAAEAGVGKQGQSLKNESGIMVEAAKAYFNVRQRSVFDIQIPQALKLFEATEGRKPRSQEEFMERIVKANNIKLPTLPGNDKYVYDVERGELMVEKRR